MRRSSAPPGCRICGVTFQRKDQVITHQFYAHDIVKHRCKICYKSYPTPFNVRRHVALSHRNPSEIGRCYVRNCGRHFGAQGEAQLTAHTKESHPGRLECVYCGVNTGCLLSLICHVGVKHPSEVGVHLSQVSRGRPRTGGLNMGDATRMME